MRLQLSSSSGFSNFTDQFRSIVEDLVGRRYVRFSQTSVWQPHVNIYETAEAFFICVDVAGMKVSEIDVQAVGKKVTIRGTRIPPVPTGVDTSDIQVHLMEIDSGAFSREVEIDSPVKQGAISAGYRDGLLWIALPKEP